MTIQQCCPGNRPRDTATPDRAEAILPGLVIGNIDMQALCDPHTTYIPLFYNDFLDLIRLAQV